MDQAKPFKGAGEGGCLVKMISSRFEPESGDLSSMVEKRQINRIQFIGIILVSIILGLIILMKGVKFSYDSVTNSSLADLLIKHNFNYFDFLASLNNEIPIVLYSAWITLVAITKVIFGDNSGTAIVVLNYIAVVYTLVLILKATRMVTEKSVCVIFACIALIFCYEFHLWITYVLSDILYASLCFSIIFISLSLFQDPSRPQVRIGICLILVGIAMFWRPLFPPLTVFIFFSMFGLILRRIANDMNKRHFLIINLTLFACVALTATLWVHSHILINPESWPFLSFKRWILQVSREYSLGVIVYGRPETFHPIPVGILDYFLMTLSKLFFFFAIDFDGYSKGHAIINYVFFVPIYALSAFSFAQLYKRENGLSSMKWWIIFSCSVFIALFAIFHSLNQIDYDLRYRVPCLPPLVLMATIGLNELLEKLKV